MKICLSIKEAKQLKTIMETVEENSVKELGECLKNNKLVKVTYGINGVSIEVDEDYTAEFFEVYGRYLDVLVSQAKVMFKTICLLNEETMKVVEKHMAKDNTEEKEEQEEVSEETKED